MSTTVSKTSRRPGRSLALAVLAIVAVVWIGLTLSEDGEGSGAVSGALVKRGPLRISVVERGNLKAANSEVLKSEIEGEATVLWLIEEGTMVEPGDLVCELDVSQLATRTVQQEIAVENAEAALVKAEQNYAIQVSQNESDAAAAERDLEFANVDLTKYLEGDMPQQLQMREEDILIADEQLSRALQDLEWSVKLAGRGFLEQAQLDADRLAKTIAEITLNQAERAKELFVSFEIPRQRKELVAAVAEQERELERVALQARARIADFEADVRSAQARLGLEQDELERNRSQIEKARLHAPTAGMVVYAVENEGRWSSGDPMQAGASVRERQDIITIPSSDGYVAEASLHESVLEKVLIDMPAQVTVDALRETFPGQVTFKAILPDQTSRWLNPDVRVYRAEIQLLTADARIRPGMSASIEILVDELQDALHVPMQAVFLDAGEPVCFVVDGDDVEIRKVEVGQNNGKWVEIRSGLTEGETVRMSQPAGITLRPVPEGGEDDGGWGGGAKDGASGGKDGSAAEGAGRGSKPGGAP